MPKRIHVTYRCDHEGKVIPEKVEKHWDSFNNPERYCLCTGKPLKMVSEYEVTDADLAPR